MGAVIRIALGNLWEHKSKTLILGIMVMLGVAIIIMGNAFLEATRRSVEADFRENYTGDVIIRGPSKDTVTLFGIQKAVNVSLPPPIPALPDTKAILDTIAELDGIRETTTLISSMGILIPDNLPDNWQQPDSTDSAPFFYLFAGDPDTYWKTFPKHRITEGTAPVRGEASIMPDEKTREHFETWYDRPLNVGDKVVIRGFNGNMQMREVTVSGFYSPGKEDTSMLGLCYIDPSTARTFADLTFGSSYIQELPPSVDTSLSALNEEDLFGGTQDMFDTEAAAGTAVLTDTSVDTILGDTALRDKLNQTDDGAWNFILLKLKNPARAPAFIAELNTLFAGKGMAVTAIDWKTAASTFAATADMLSGIFTLLIGILAVVVFIVIMNTLIVSIMERTAEIGTMRAMGADRSFIRGLFFTESVSITCIAALAGILLALAVTSIVNVSHITVTGETARLFLGGASITMIPTVTSALSTFLVVLAGSAAANLYPLAVALKITPLQAMNREQ